MGAEAEGQVPNQEGQEPTGEQQEQQVSTEQNTEASQEQPKTFSEDYVKGLRAEAASWRTKAQEAEGKVKEFEDSQKSDLERAQAAAAEAEAKAKEAEERAQQVALSAAIRVEAASLGFVDADTALALVDRSGIEFDDAGQPSGVKEALEALKKAKPFLIGSGGGANPANGNQKKTGLTMEDLDSMTPEQVEARWDEVQKMLKAQQEA